VALNEGLFKGQDQTEQDLTNGPGWTIDQEKPTFWEGTGGALLRGPVRGAMDGIGVLSGAMQKLQSTGGESDEMTPEMQEQIAKTPIPQSSPFLSNVESSARDYAKTLTPDPRVTGTGANIVEGVGHAITLFGAGAMVGGPVAGAGLLGTASGYARYHDLLDEGVDRETARNAALVEGAAQGVGSLMPMGLPAKYLAGLTGGGEALAQIGTGAALNTGFGLAQRYASAKILRDAGYPEMADQAAVWDKTNIAADAISGMFFGGVHHVMGGLHVKDIDPALNDAAKVVQDRQAVMQGAPGVPVDMKSQAINRQSLEKALGDLLSDKPVELNGDDVHGASFARPEENTAEAREIMREEMMKSGVLDDAAQFDRWLSGEKEPELKEPEPKIEPKEEGELPAEFAKPKTGEEETPQQNTSAALAERPDLKIVDENGEARPAIEAQAKAAEDEALANKEAEPMHQAAADCEARYA
jgi:hypothetical protein